MTVPAVPVAFGDRPAPGAPRSRPAPVVARVLRTERLSASMVRVVLGGEGLRPFVPSEFADSYVKLGFAPTGADLDVLDRAPLGDDGRVDRDALRDLLPAATGPLLRAYTVRSFDPDRLELALDVVEHGDDGIAGPWASRAAPGEPVLVNGPGGAWSPDPTVDDTVLIGDASALPAIAVGLERMALEARGVAVVEVHGPDDEIPLDGPAGVRIAWVHQGDAPAGERLVEAALALDWPSGTVDAFVHGEAGAVRVLRRWLRAEKTLPLERLSISGYWRLGHDEDRWQSTKREWNQNVEREQAEPEKAGS